MPKTFSISVFILLACFANVFTLKADVGIFYHLQLTDGIDTFYFRFHSFGQIEQDLLVYSAREVQKVPFNTFKTEYFQFDQAVTFFRQHHKARVSVRRGGRRRDYNLSHLSTEFKVSITPAFREKLQLLRVVGDEEPAFACSAAIFYDEDPWPSKLTLEHVFSAGDHEFCKYNFYAVKDGLSPAKLATMRKTIQAILLEKGEKDFKDALNDFYKKGIFMLGSCAG